MKRALALVVGLLLVGAPLFAYSIVLKNGSIIFARDKYTIKGNKAILTLENGTVVSYDVDQIDVAATEKYNKDNPGNVIALDTPDKSGPPLAATSVPQTTLQDVLRRKKVSLGVAPPKAASGESSASTFQNVDPTVEQAFRKILDGASIMQYRLATYRGKVRLLATANTEEAVFNTIAAAARALSDLANRGKVLGIDIVLTTSSGDAAGSFEMNQDQAKQIVNGNITAADFFVKYVVL